jgi:hypothetical protein
VGHKHAQLKREDESERMVAELKARRGVAN